MAICRKKKSAMDEVVDLFNDVFIHRQDVVGNVSKGGTDNADKYTQSAAGESCVDLDLSNFDLFADDVSPANVTTAADGLIVSLNTYGKVDVEYIAELTGKTVKEVLRELRGSIYQNPEKFDGDLTSGWETADEYLSGNLGEKLRAAQRYNKEYYGYFNANILALNAVMPKSVDLDQIHITIGTPWIPVAMMEAFIRYIVNVKRSDFLVHDDVTGSWEIKDKYTVACCGDHTKIRVTFGTYRMDALHIIEKTLNMQTIKIMDETVDFLGKKKSVVNEKETLLALDKQKKILEVFERWIFRDEKRKAELQRIYEDTYCCIRTRKFDGSFLTLPNLSDKVELYPYQKNAIARILFTPNTLLAHDVGAGKTYIMVAAGMELKRMGISNKNVYVVPNNIVDQWADVFSEMYPTAKLLRVSPNKFTPAKRQAVLRMMKDGDYDAVIMAYSCFSMIPMSRKYVEEDYRQQIEVLKNVVANGYTNRTVKDRIKALQKELEKYRDSCTLQAGEITFDELGVNTLFVDEAHNFKNLPFETKTGGILGVSSTGSRKCRDMYNKVKCVQAQNNGRGVVFATGTPITNSISDLFIIQKYLQSGVLESLNLGTFDSWIANFAELVTGFEIDVDTSGYRMARRFSKFHNLPELTTLLSLIADFHPARCCAAMPKFNGYTDCVTEKSKALEEYIHDISKRADKVRNRSISMKVDNMLKITTDGRKAALDLRLVEPKSKFDVRCKIFQCARNVSDVYFKTYSDGGTQLVFCDSSTPKVGFNAYDEMKRVLVNLGVPEKEIAFIHDATTDTQREALFERMRNSQVRVLMGSTWKLGVGVNIQDRLVAIHHLDVPWRPADMVQREGRILRPGNLNEEVFIYRYITKDTFDAYSWQLLETKQRFINGLLAGTITRRNDQDVGDTVLNYAEVKALALGNPLVKARVEAANELSKLLTLQKRNKELRLDMASQIEALPAYIDKKQVEIEQCIKDIEYYNANKVTYTWDELRQLGKVIMDGLKENDYETTERVVAEYQGFKIILPAGMMSSDPFVYVERNGRYKLNYRMTDIGIMLRLNHLLDGLSERLDELELAKARLEDKLLGLEAEMSREENYGDQIMLLKEKLARLDRKLGVKANG